MAQQQVSCPACKRMFSSDKGIILHFRQALSGWDPSWDSRQPHTAWARSKGIAVTDEGYTFDFEKLNSALHKTLGS